MKPRASTRRAMVDALTALDDRAKFHASFARGFAVGLAASGLRSDSLDLTTDTDNGFWAVDADGRQIWIPIP